MNSRILVVAGLLVAAAPVAAHAQQTEVVVAPVVVTGEVIGYEPGRTIVIKSDGRDVSYALTPELSLPAEVQLGRRVTVHSERGADGTARVTRVVTTSLTPEGQVQRTTEETRVGDSGLVTQMKTTVITTTSITPEGEAKKTVEETRTTPSGDTTKTTTVTVQGTVKTYTPGKSFTILKADGTPVTYKIAENANMPAELAVGKMVTIHQIPGSGLRIVVEKEQ